MKGRLITFEGNEGSGKSTQIALLCEQLKTAGVPVRNLREPGGTAIGEEIRHTFKHSQNNWAMTPETELLLMNASRAQLVREIIRPALDAGEFVLCDRFYDSTLAYQGYGRQLDLDLVRKITELAVGQTRPDLTLLLLVPENISEQRRQARQSTQPNVRDRMEEGDREFFERVVRGYEAIATAEPRRVRRIEASAGIAEIAREIWGAVHPLLEG